MNKTEQFISDNTTIHNVNGYGYSFSPKELVKILEKFGGKNIDLATLVLMTMYYGQSNAGRLISTNDVDTLITLAEKFEEVYKDANWEEQMFKDGGTTWEDSIIIFFNANKPQQWNDIQ